MVSRKSLEDHVMATEAQINANRRNAAKSTGPKTTQGKAAVAMNALKHGLRARRDVVLGEEQEEFDLHRKQFFEELAPVGKLETTLAGRIVSLTWRLQRAERLQNEVFDALVTVELAESMAEFEDELSPEQVQELMSDPSADPRLAIGRMVARDFRGDRTLERLLAYEQRIEGSLRRALADLGYLRLAGKAAAAGRRPRRREPVNDSAEQSQLATAGPDSAKQSQLPISQENHRQAALDAATRTVAGDGVKQSQLDRGVSSLKCEVSSSASAPMGDDSDEQSQLPADASCGTKPICPAGQMVCSAHPTSGADSAKETRLLISEQGHRQAALDAATRTVASDGAEQSQSRGSGTVVRTLPRCVRRAAWRSHKLPRSH
jgi:hypothetical protein